MCEARYVLSRFENLLGRRIIDEHLAPAMSLSLLAKSYHLPAIRPIPFGPTSVAHQCGRH